MLIWSIFSGAGAASSQSQADRIFGPCSYKRRSGALSLSVLMRFWRGEVMPVNEEEFVWPPVTFWLMKNRNGAKPLQQSLNTEHIFRIIISYFDETLQDELTLLRQGALSCPAPALPPSIRKKEGRKALVAAVYGLGSAAASAAALLTGIIHAWHLNAPIQNLSFPISPTSFCIFTACTF